MITWQAIIGILAVKFSIILLIRYYLQKKRIAQVQQREQEKIKAYGESINEETRNKKSF